MINYTSLINEITKKIVAGAQPEKIVLFGSLASGNPRENSDIDLLIVKESSKRRDERDIEIRKFLKDILYPMDIFVYTPKEVEQYRNLSSSFLKKVFDTGKIIYERK
jgi:predicted nucleotidyltransferase